MIADHPLLRLIIITTLGLSLHFKDTLKNLGKFPNPHGYAALAYAISPAFEADFADISLIRVVLETAQGIAVQAPPPSFHVSPSITNRRTAGTGVHVTTRQTTHRASAPPRFQPMESRVIAFLGHPALVPAIHMAEPGQIAPARSYQTAGRAAEAAARSEHEYGGPPTGLLVLSGEGTRRHLPVVVIETQDASSSIGVAQANKSPLRHEDLSADPVRKPHESRAGLPWTDWPMDYRSTSTSPEPHGELTAASAARPFYLLADTESLGAGVHRGVLDGAPIEIIVLGGLAASMSPRDAWALPMPGASWATPDPQHPLACFRRMLLNRTALGATALTDGTGPDASATAPSDPIVEAFGRGLALRWRYGLLRLRSVSWGVADALEEVLTRRCFDGNLQVAAWPADTRALADLEALLLDERLGPLVEVPGEPLNEAGRERDRTTGWSGLDRAERDVVGRILDWIERQPQVVCWIESDAGPQVQVAVANLTREPRAVALEWPGTSDPPVGLLIDPLSVERTSMPRPETPAEPVPDAGRGTPADAEEDATPGGGADAALDALRASGFLSGRSGTMTDRPSRNGDPSTGRRQSRDAMPEWARGITLPARPTELLIDAGRHRSVRLLTAAESYPVTPPGVTMDRFSRSWTVERWRQQQSEVVLEDSATRVSLQRSILPPPGPLYSGWELFIECIVDPSRATVTARSPSAPLGVDDLPGHDAVCLFVGGYPIARAILAIGPSIGVRPTAPDATVDAAAASADPDMMFGAAMLPIHETRVRAGSDRWTARVPIPQSWFEGHYIDIGAMRTHSDLPDRIETMPRPVLPWRLDPGRVRFDVSAWPALPQEH